MGGACRLVRGGSSVEARWRRDGDALVVSPAGQPALAVALERVAGIGGDGHAIRLRAPGGELALERLGADGPTLLGELRRDWPPLRAKALRLDGGEVAREVWTGTVVGAALRGDFRGWLAGARLLLAVGDGDLSALFLADFAAVALDEETWSLRCAGWGGGETVLAKLGARTAACAAALREARGALALEAAAAVGGNLATLDAGARAGLAEVWLPGRLLSLEELERTAPGFGEAFRTAWLPGLPREAEGKSLLAGVAPGQSFLGYAAAPAGERPLLWLLARRPDAWYLELLSHGDYATYLFAGGDEVRGLVEGLIRLPEFSREALYLPESELVGERSAYAIPARELPLLRELRASFQGRKVHRPEAAG